MMKRKLIIMFAFFSIGLSVVGQKPDIVKTSDLIDIDFPISEFVKRRNKALEIYSDGIVIFPSNTRLKTWEQQGFVQNTNFYYYTGLSNAVGAILVLDGLRRKALLFVPSTIGLSEPLESKALIQITDRNKAILSVDSLLKTDAFDNYISKRLNESINLRLYSAFQSDGIRIQNYDVVPDPWILQLQSKWPNSEIAQPLEALKQQEIKSKYEIDAMRRAGENVSRGLIEALKSIKPKIPSREVEGVVVKECLCNGGNGVYFWPLVVQGKNASYPEFFRIFSDYKNLSDILTEGELVRIDLGCDYNHYKSDVGRTAPVSGRFSESQREIYNLLVHGYLAGLKSMKDGASREVVLKAFTEKIQTQETGLKTDLGKKALQYLLTKEGTENFQIHEMGLGGTEKQVSYLRDGMVVAWEPMFTIENESYYLEDMVAITKTGYEILTPGLPYFAEDIEKTMRSRNEIK